MSEKPTWDEKINNAFIATTSKKEFDRILRYAFSRMNEGMKGKPRDTLFYTKMNAITARRVIASSSGLAIGLYFSGVGQEFVRFLTPSLIALTAAVLGINYVLDRRIEKHLQGR